MERKIIETLFWVALFLCLAGLGLIIFGFGIVIVKQAILL
jgi:hypothetical protein